MFGRGTAALFGQMPPLDGLDVPAAKRMLSAAYLDILVARTTGERRSGPEHAGVVDFLRRLASALESFAVFDPRSEHDLRSGSAFVAAEALALLAEQQPLAGVEAQAVDTAEAARRALQRKAVRVEAGLLYLIAGFEPNAATLLSQEDIAPIFDAAQNVDLALMDWALRALIGLCQLDTDGAQEEPPVQARSLLGVNVASAVRADLLRRIGDAVRMYLGWLAGNSNDGFERAQQSLEDVRRVLTTHKATQHADIFHLCRITAAAMTAMAPRAVRTVPLPTEDVATAYRAYLLSRARGPRPILWPAAQAYVQGCLPGPHSHAVVSVPTGAGKGFLAEIAVSQGLATGWALYLVPTNALANQVRHDLERALREFSGAQVRAFLGGDEYTTLSQEHAANVPVGTVVVMTPEKCALALRLAPEAFATCRVCVFDECHLLSDGTRGVLAELVVSHITAISAACRFVFMSAMMANPGDVKAWIESATRAPAVVIQSPWRPTRTMRGVVGADLVQAQQAADAAATALTQATRPSRGRPRKRMPFNASHVVVANLQGPWSEIADDDYALVQLPTVTELAVKKEDRGPTLDRSGWVNGTSAALTTFLAGRRFSVLTFLPSNRHHCFSVAAEVTLPADVVPAAPVADHVNALLTIAEDELGVRSAVAELIGRRLAVHTSALLDSEKIASEVAFQGNMAVAMFATGTLAQGLNLPASVVVIGGTAVGDRREADTPEGRRRTRSQLLNALGRAGRAGFANHGLALVVTDQPIFFQLPPDTQLARQEAAFLVEEDDSTVVDSRLQAFVEAVLGGRLNVETASPEELVALSYLPLEPVGNVSAEQILSRSYAIHRRSTAREDDATRAAAELVRVGREYVQRVAAPEWITAVAYKTGLPFLLCLRVHEALQRVIQAGTQRPSTLEAWRDLLFRTLANLPPLRAREILLSPVKSEGLNALWDATLQGDDAYWNPPPQWAAAWGALEEAVSAYMAGQQLADLARSLFAIDAGVAVDPRRTTGAMPIPRTIDFVNDVLERLSRVAGVLVAIDESASIAINTRERSVESVRSLSELPLAIRYGCPSRDVLAWFRFGIRFRRPAHLLARRFPVPHDIVEDSEVQRWVRQQRSSWLGEQQGDAATPDDAVLRAARVVLTS